MKRFHLDIENYGAINLNAKNYEKMYLDIKNYVNNVASVMN